MLIRFLKMIQRLIYCVQSFSYRFLKHKKQELFLFIKVSNEDDVVFNVVKMFYRLALQNVLDMKND